MREVKFRVWDKEDNIMIDGEYWLLLDSMGCVYEYKMGRLSDESKKYDVMQYTGLKDKNGKEIYEGDIVDGEFRINVNGKDDITTGKIKYYSPSFCICPPNSSKFIMPYNDNILVEKNTNYRVVGNIYEHKHLLK